jgi:hypothetical protein
MLIDNVDRVIGQRQLNADLREAREEFVHDRYDVEASEDNRRGHCKRTTRDAVLSGGLCFCLLDLFQDAFAGCNVGDGPEAPHSPRLAEAPDGAMWFQGPVRR